LQLEQWMICCIGMSTQIQAEAARYEASSPK
jgi:hypothetical protein